MTNVPPSGMAACRTPASGWTNLFWRRERVRLRFIRTFFDIRIPGLKMTVVAADGRYVEPVSVEEFRIGVAEAHDVLGRTERRQRLHHLRPVHRASGFARGTLTPHPNVTAEVPEMDPAPSLTHTDMGMDMSGMDMGDTHAINAPPSAMDHSGHDMGGANPSVEQQVNPWTWQTPP